MIMTLLSSIYTGIVRLRLTLYKYGIRKIKRLDRPVISIGNITMGGTGKTPFTIFTARLLVQAGFSPAILSRGYRGTAEKRNLLISNREGILHPANVSGDEPRLMAENLPRVPIAVGGNRYRSGIVCLQDPSANPDLFILDDGFQHVQLYRDIDIVLIDATSPFGGGETPPKGILREPLSSLRRADALVITRSHLAKENRDLIRARLRNFSPSAPVFFFSHRISGFHALGTNLKQQESFQADPPGKSAFVLAAIGNPFQFLKDLDKLGLKIEGKILMRDHHLFTQPDVDQAIEQFRDSGAEFMVTTEKDSIKLKNLDLRDVPIYFAAMRMYSGEEDRFRSWLLGKLPSPST